MLPIDHTYPNFLAMRLSIEHSIPTITFLFFSYWPDPYVIIILLRLEGLLLRLTLLHLLLQIYDQRMLFSLQLKRIL